MLSSTLIKCNHFTMIWLISPSPFPFPLLLESYHIHTYLSINFTLTLTVMSYSTDDVMMTFLWALLSCGDVKLWSSAGEVAMWTVKLWYPAGEVAMWSYHILQPACEFVLLTYKYPIDPPPFFFFSRNILLLSQSYLNTPKSTSTTIFNHNPSQLSLLLNPPPFLFKRLFSSPRHLGTPKGTEGSV